MPKSMTAFARQDARHDWGSLSWELRTVNSRYLEIHLRLPEELRGLEAGVRERIGARLKRGKLEGLLRFDARLADAALQIDHNVVRSLTDACHEVEGELRNPGRINPLDILQWPGVVQQPQLDMEALGEALLALLDTALDELVAMREREGERLKGFLLERLQGIEEQVVVVREQRPKVLQAQREKLTARLRELQAEYDNQRLEQELVYMAQKLDVAEELDRLQSHVAEFRDVLERKEPIGRRLDFLMQEFNREANTLGSKSADSATTQAAVELKVLIEQMREQVQNLE